MLPKLNFCQILITLFFSGKRAHLLTLSPNLVITLSLIISKAQTILKSHLSIARCATYKRIELQLQITSRSKTFSCFFKEVARGGERTRVLSISFIFSFSPLYRCATAAPQGLLLLCKLLPFLTAALFDHEEQLCP
jgi:hypothetical protein